MSRIDNNIKIKELIEDETGCKFKHNLMKCVFHTEKTGSLSIKTSGNYFNCFGCGVGGGPIEFIMKYRNLSYGESIKYLEEKYPGKLLSLDEKTKKYISHEDKIRSKQYGLYELYTFTDIHGNPIYYKTKYVIKASQTKKGVCYYRFDENDEIQPDLGGMAQVPYNLEYLYKALEEDKPVYIVEGEKDANTLIYTRGVTATSFKGVTKLPEGLNFEGKHVYFCGDTGEAGEEYKKKVYHMIGKDVESFNVITLPGLTELGDNKDVTDWFQAGHTVEEFEQAVDWSWNWKAKSIPQISWANHIASRDIYKFYQGVGFHYSDNRYVKDTSPDVTKKRILKGLRSSQATDKYANSVYNLMKWENRVEETQNKRYISFNNGILDLKTFKLIPHTATIFTTFAVDCDYRPLNRFNLEESTLWQYLTSTFNDDMELIQLTQQIFGNILLPNPAKFKTIVGLLGEGNNGKSVFINLCKALAGDYCSAVPLKDLGSNRFAAYNLIGCNVNLEDDASGNKLKETNLIKSIATGGEISLERKGSQAEKGILNILLIVGLNKMPSSDDKSYGWIRRWTIIPFNQEFATAEELPNKPDAKLMDPDIEDKILNDELELLFSYAVEGLKKLIKNGYKVIKPKAVQEEVQRYRDDIDSISAYATYLKDCESVGEEEIMSSDVFKNYILWCESEGRTPDAKSSKSFGMRFSKLWKDGKKDRYGTWYKVPKTLKPKTTERRSNSRNTGYEEDQF